MKEMCLREEASCQCYRPKRHKPPHRCRCGGAWWVNRQGQWIPYAFPDLDSPFVVGGGDPAFGRLSND